MATAEEMLDLSRVQVESLKYQKDIERCNVSESCKNIMEFIKENEETDHFTNPDYPKDKKANPWIEQKKCTIL